MALTKVTRNNQITIPKKVCEQLELRVGDYVDVVIDKGIATLKPLALIPKTNKPKKAVT